jgi:multiple sugar transport system ATP-binding protein
MAQVRLTDITKRFGELTIVDRINLNIRDKEFLVLVGPSGCGKTTTLRMIAGLEEVTEGKIFIGEHVVNDIPPKNRDIAMVFQNYALYPHMNIYKNMAFGLKLKKLPKDEIDQRVRKGAEILGIQDLLARKPKQLSGGQRQRVAMGRAIVRQPKVFLFDEPLSNLDAKLRVQMRAELSKLHERLQTTIIYVTHDQVEAMTLADRIAVMKHGHIMQIGSPLEVYEHPQNQFVAGFIGSTPMNFMDARLMAENGRMYVDCGDFNLQVPQVRQKQYEARINQEVVFGIRPDNIDELCESSPAECEPLEGIVDNIEPLGSEVILMVNVGKYRLTARVDPKTKARLHQPVKLTVDMHKMHLFDKQSGRTIA